VISSKNKLVLKKPKIAPNLLISLFLYVQCGIQTQSAQKRPGKVYGRI